jgi:hypothetical protein
MVAAQNMIQPLLGTDNSTDNRKHYVYNNPIYISEVKKRILTVQIIESSYRKTTFSWMLSAQNHWEAFQVPKK